MGWVELTVELPRERLETASALLFALGAAGVQEDHLPGEAPPPRQPWDEGPPPAPSARVLLRAWLEDADREAVAREVRLRLGVEPRLEDVPETDWEVSWRHGFEPVIVSERLVVAQPWNAPEGALVIEPGRGFGTGLHPTTRGALAALDALADGARDALDVGCGSGILALAAARLGLRSRGVDVDPLAVADARENAARNQLASTFSTTPVHALEEPADLVLANLHAELLVALAADLVRLTRLHLVLAGVLHDREERVRAAFDPHLHLEHREVDGEWVVLRYRRAAR